MKKIFATIASFALALGIVNAQDLAGITEIYNSGAAAITAGDKEGALKSFEQALSLATALGADGEEIAQNCKNVIPDLNLSIAKGLVNSSNYPAAIERIKTTIEIAQNFANEDVLTEATNLLPKIIMQNAGSLLNAKDYAGAASAYKEVLASDPRPAVERDDPERSFWLPFCGYDIRFHVFDGVLHVEELILLRSEHENERR